MDSIRFSTADHLTLEGELRLPDGAPAGTAILCHPHPLRGGSKDHPVLWALRAELSRRGFVVLGFNFRGVMGSEGRYGGGVDEVKDVRAAIDRVRQAGPPPTFVVGWSFGAHVALRAAPDDVRIGALALVSLPLAQPVDLGLPELPPLPTEDALGAFQRPVLLIAGESDPFCPVPELEAFARNLPDATVRVVPGTDHYFGRREREMAAVAGGFATARLLKPT
jgi:uncharacterized protein